MSELQSALRCMTLSGIPLSSCCRFSADLLIPGIRSASRLPKNPKSILIGLFPYFTGFPPESNLSLYSCIPDYHAVAGNMLSACCKELNSTYPDNEFVPFVDASPIYEVTAALRAGLGVRGKNGQLITEQYGSLVFIGEIVTDADFGAVDHPENSCENCGICITACPTGALKSDSFDKTVCRSHFSQKKGELSNWECSQLKDGGLVWGCDICTLACPHNRLPKLTPIKEFLQDTEPLLTADNLEHLMNNRAFAWRGEKVLKRNLSILNR